MRQKKLPFPLVGPSVVGVVHTVGGFAAAGRAGVDVVEVRCDLLVAEGLAERVARLRRPRIATVRGVDEGGRALGTARDRAEVVREFLPIVEAIDVEASALGEVGGLVEDAHAAGCVVIASVHDFHGVPGLGETRKLAVRARRRGADVVKLAATVETPQALADLLRLGDALGAPFALMGMGRFGKLSRLACALAGSVLNYGWLDRPQVDGQWPAAEFRKALAAVQ